MADLDPVRQAVGIQKQLVATGRTGHIARAAAEFIVVTRMLTRLEALAGR